MNILIVDDNHSDVFLIHKILKEVRNDIHFTVLYNGDDTLAFIKTITTTQDLIIIDYNLPDRNGIEILKELRKVNTQVPVVLFTSSDLHKNDEDIITLCAVHAQKPMNYDDYFTKVMSFLDLVKTKQQHQTLSRKEF